MSTDTRTARRERLPLLQSWSLPAIAEKTAPGSTSGEGGLLVPRSARRARGTARNRVRERRRILRCIWSAGLARSAPHRTPTGYIPQPPEMIRIRGGMTRLPVDDREPRVGDP
jgi:hypothetical protein